MNITDKVAVVTGGAGLYGSCIVEGLAEADATVITASRNLEAGEAFAAGLREQGLDVHARRLDQADHASVLALKDGVLKDFGGLDVFVNNAVARPVSGGWDGFTLEDVTESMEIRVQALMHHNSQVNGRVERVRERIMERTRETGKEKGYEHAEAFKLIKL